MVEKEIGTYDTTDLGIRLRLDDGSEFEIQRTSRHEFSIRTNTGRLVIEPATSNVVITGSAR